MEHTLSDRHTGTVVGSFETETPYQAHTIELSEPRGTATIPSSWACAIWACAIWAGAVGPVGDAPPLDLPRQPGSVLGRNR